MADPLQGTRRVLLRRATAGEFTRGIYNPLAMSSRGRYVLVEGLAPSSTSGAGRVHGVCAWWCTSFACVCEGGRARGPGHRQFA
jgi:hypothetical protein